jgi:hypothetical protein
MRPSPGSNVYRTYVPLLKETQMNAARRLSCLAACFVLALASTPSKAQQPTPNPIAAACGSTDADFDVKHTPGSSTPAAPPARKALIYVIEAMNSSPFVTTKVNIGLDGHWVGATDAQSHISFPVSTGTHHLCAVYQGKAESMDAEGHTLLLDINLEPGQVYYVRYHAVFLKDSPNIAFFEKVDDSEGLLLMQRTETATSVLKKK